MLILVDGSAANFTLGFLPLCTVLQAVLVFELFPLKKLAAMR